MRRPSLPSPLVVALGAALVAVVGTYQASHAYPAWSGGLYLQAATSVVDAGYTLPTTIPGYTSGGLPFAYPPLGFFAIGALLDLGVSPRAIALWLPSLAIVVGAVAVTYLGATITDDYRTGLVAALVYFTSPGLLRGTISGLGMIRAPAIAVSAVALAVGFRLFRNGPTGDQRRTLALAIVLFAAIAALHPEYAAFVGISYVAFWAWLDHSLRGLARGIAVAVGGAILTAPWWVTVVRRHGLGVFDAASGTHGGVLSLTWPLAILNTPPGPLPTLWPALIAVGALYLVVRGDWFLPAWLVVVGTLLGREDHLLLIGGLVVGVVTIRHVLPAVRASALAAFPDRVRTRVPGGAALAVGLLLVGVVGYQVVVAGAYVATLPTFADGEDREMMETLDDGATDGAPVAVIGDAGEWLPFYADVTHVTSVRGTEWTGDFDDRLGLRAALTRCLSAACVTETLRSANVSAASIYVALDGYSRSNYPSLQPARRLYLVPSLLASDDYRVTDRSENVVIAEITNESIASSR